MSFYNETHVKLGRKQKHCMSGGTTIEIGKSAWTITHLEEYSTSTLYESCHELLPKHGITTSSQLFSHNDLYEVFGKIVLLEKLDIILGGDNK